MEIEELIKDYGEPVYRKVIDRTGFTTLDLAKSQVPNEIAVFRLEHPFMLMICGKHTEWHRNYGERVAVNELLKEIEQLKQALADAKVQGVRE